MFDNTNIIQFSRFFCFSFFGPRILEIQLEEGRAYRGRGRRRAEAWHRGRRRARSTPPALIVPAPRRQYPSEVPSS